jgi:hypothetical protein
MTKGRPCRHRKPAPLGIVSPPSHPRPTVSLTAHAWHRHGRLVVPASSTCGWGPTDDADDAERSHGVGRERTAQLLDAELSRPPGGFKRRLVLRMPDGYPRSGPNMATLRNRRLREPSVPASSRALHHAQRAPTAHRRPASRTEAWSSRLAGPRRLLPGSPAGRSRTRTGAHAPLRRLREAGPALEL